MYMISDFFINLYYKIRRLSPKILILLSAELTFNILNFIVASVLVRLVFYFSPNSQIKTWFGSETTFVIISLSLIFIIAVVVYYIRHRVRSLHLYGYKKLNEIMTNSFQKILEVFIEKMILIKESTKKEKIMGYLQEFNEELLFKQLILAIYKSLNEMFDGKLETKIDVYKHDDIKNELIPIYTTNINGTFTNNRSDTFSVKKNQTSYASLGEYTYSRNKTVCLLNIPFLESIFENLSDKGKNKFADKYRFYYKKIIETEGFHLGSIFCFPLRFNGTRYGILSIGFKENKIEKNISSIGIKLDEFSNCIELFISNYTKFVLEVSKGIVNLLLYFDKK